MLTGQRSIRVGFKLGRLGLDVGWIWAGLGPPRGVLWRCHVVAVGLYWASSTALAHGALFMVDAGSRSMDLRQGP